MEGIEESDKDFDYLLGMKLWSLTLERVAALEAQLNAKYGIFIKEETIFITFADMRRSLSSRPSRLRTCGTRTWRLLWPAGMPLSMLWRSLTTHSLLVRQFRGQ